MEKLNASAGHSMSIVEDNIAKLKGLFPEIFNDGKIDFKVLQELLGKEIELEDERYSFNWHGKVNARRVAQSPSTGTLRPHKEESLNWNTTQNLFLEGDNLEILKLLQKSYHKKVKMIYIDPPYNTGKEFIYPDNYQDNLDTYLEYTGQKDTEGRKFGTNSETSGRYHTNWLNMIYPRLKLARNLLRDDGVIFISIDDHEQVNLKKICDEIFGEENFIANLCVINNMKGRNDKANIATAHEYLLIYSKSNFVSYGVPLTEEQLKEYKHEDEHDEKYALRDLRKRGRPDRREDRPNMFFPIYFNEKNKACSLERNNKDDIEIIPLKGDKSEGRWRWGRGTIEANLDILHPKYSNQKDRWDIQHRVYLNPDVRTEPTDEETDDDDKDFQRTSKPKSFWWGGDISTDVANREVKKLFPGLNPDYPKSPFYMEKLIHMATKSGDIILDFFAGYATTAQAVLNVNLEQSSNRKFIVIQLPEKLDPDNKDQKETYEYCIQNKINPLISSLGKERIERAIKEISKNTNHGNIDLGFRVFKLDSSNLKPWDAEFDTLAQDLADSTEVIKIDRKPEDVLFEILLKYGLDLTLPIDTHSIAGKTVYEVGAGALIVCLDDDITEAVTEGIGKLKEQLEPEVMRVVFKDSSFANDAAKVNAVQVLKQYGIADVKSI